MNREGFHLMSCLFVFFFTIISCTHGTSLLFFIEEIKHLNSCRHLPPYLNSDRIEKKVEIPSYFMT